MSKWRGKITYRYSTIGPLIEQQISYFNVINLNVVVVNEVICSTKKDR